MVNEVFTSNKRTSKSKAEPIEPIIPDSYTLIAADLSLKRPGFCKVFMITKDGHPHIDRVELMSVDNKNKLKARGMILKEIKEALTQFCFNESPVFFVRERSVNNCIGKLARSGTAARTGVSEVVGIADLVAWEHSNKEWDEIFPVTIKKILTGNGKAEKQDVAKALHLYFTDIDYKNDDESDAAAVAIAWLINHKQISQILQEDKENE